MITLTQEAWKRFAPRCPDAYTRALFDNLNLIEDAGILETELRWCHFAGTVFEETGDFSECRENMNYTTCSVLRSTWPSRFGHRTDDELKPFLRNPHALADAVYSGRMGNRPGTSDAFDYRGGGFIQTTGRAAVEGYCQKLGIQPTPRTLDDPVLTLKFAVLEWTEAKCNQWADEHDIVKVAKAINTGSAASNVTPIGMNDRRAAFARAWKLWGETGEADHPAGIGDVSDAVRGALKKGGAALGGTAATGGTGVALLMQTTKTTAPPTLAGAQETAAAARAKIQAVQGEAKAWTGMASDAGITRSSFATWATGEALPEFLLIGAALGAVAAYEFWFKRR